MHSSQNRAGTATEHQRSPPQTRQRVLSHHFTSSRETLPPQLYGLRQLEPQEVRAPNESLMHVSNNRTHQLQPPQSWRSLGFAGGSVSTRHTPGTLGRHSAATDLRMGSNFSRDGGSDAAHTSDLGYWEVTFVTRSGNCVGASKLMVPRGKAPTSFEDIVEAIAGDASLLNLVVAYITYLDRNFNTYTLLTPRSVCNCTDTFRVVVELKEGCNPHLCPASRQDESTGVSNGEILATEDVAGAHEGSGVKTMMGSISDGHEQSSTVTSLRQSPPGTGFFRNVISSGSWQQRCQYDFLTPSERVTENYEALEAALTLSRATEEEDRRSIALDEGSSRATLAVMAERHKSAVVRGMQRETPRGDRLSPRPRSAPLLEISETNLGKPRHAEAEDKLQLSSHAATITVPVLLQHGVFHNDEGRPLQDNTKHHPPNAAPLDSSRSSSVTSTDTDTELEHKAASADTMPGEREGTPSDQQREEFDTTKNLHHHIYEHEERRPSTELKTRSANQRQSPYWDQQTLTDLTMYESLQSPHCPYNNVVSDTLTNYQIQHDFQLNEEKSEEEEDHNQTAKAYIQKRLASLTDTLQQLEEEQNTYFTQPVTPMMTTSIQTKSQTTISESQLYQNTQEQISQLQENNIATSSRIHNTEKAVILEKMNMITEVGEGTAPREAEQEIVELDEGTAPLQAEQEIVELDEGTAPLQAEQEIVELDEGTAPLETAQEIVDVS
ncbi:putative microtubule-associated protein Gb4, partial [Trypanosoma rangeli]